MLLLKLVFHSTFGHSPTCGPDPVLYLFLSLLISAKLVSVSWGENTWFSLIQKSKPVAVKKGSHGKLLVILLICFLIDLTNHSYRYPVQTELQNPQSQHKIPRDFQGFPITPGTWANPVRLVGFKGQQTIIHPIWIFHPLD